jgi:hypothetical protein
MKQTPLSLYADNLIAENSKRQNASLNPQPFVMVPAHQYVKDGKKEQNEAFKLTAEDAQALITFREKLSVTSRIQLEEIGYEDQLEMARSVAENWI